MILSQNLFQKILASKQSSSCNSPVPFILKNSTKVGNSIFKTINVIRLFECYYLHMKHRKNMIVLSNSVQPKFLTFIIKLYVKCTDHSKVHVSCYKDDSITGQARRQLLTLMFHSKTLKQGPTVHIPFLSNQSTIERQGGSSHFTLIFRQLLQETNTKFFQIKLLALRLAVIQSTFCLP